MLVVLGRRVSMVLARFITWHIVLLLQNCPSYTNVANVPENCNSTAFSTSGKVTVFSLIKAVQGLVQGHTHDFLL